MTGNTEITADALADLGQAEEIGRVFAGFQKYLYQPQAFA
jgi:type I restriction enzyme R subunit